MVIFLAACAWVTDEDVEKALDRDGDGAVDARWGGEDCDDEDAAVGPHAEEVCDGADNDCDGAEDDAPTDGDPYYLDADGDEHGDAATEVVACEPPGTGWVADGTDCDDGDGAVSPAAAEVCDRDDVDEDCDGAADDADPQPPAATHYVDADGDGWGAGDGVSADTCTPPDGWAERGGDCDDGDLAVSPDATEVCGGVDEDCSGDLDDVADPPTLYQDLDGDEFGNPAMTTEACAAPGYVDDDSDCDDADASIHPGADEHCDDVDEDCDDAVDEDAVDPSTWYEDGDGDGWGTSGTTEACDLPEGYAADDGDCDDGEPTTYPGASEDCDSAVDRNCDGSTGRVDGDRDGSIACEDCDDGDADVFPGATETCDGKDDDCDGATDDDDADVTGRDTFYPDDDGDGFGDETAGDPWCEAPAGWVADGEDCDDAAPGVNPDARERCDDAVDGDCTGDADDCDPTLAGADAWLRGLGAGDDAGTALVALGDDVAVGAPDASGAGAVYLVAGTWTGAATADATWTGASGDDAGAALASPGDAGGDADDDLVVGAPGGDAVYVTFDPFGGGLLSSADLELYASDAMRFGEALAAADVDADGAPDVLVGAPGFDSSAVTTDVGAVYLLYGRLPTGQHDETFADVAIESAAVTSGRELGRSLAAGDTDGDGAAEIFVGADPDTVSPGAVYVFERPTGVVDENDALARIDADSSGDDAGAALATGGDFDGDGYDDLLVGAPDVGTGGVAYLVLGPATADLDLAGADARYDGVATGDEAGAAIAFAGDLDGDGASELLVGAPGAPMAYLLFGAARPASASLSDAAARWGPESASDLAGAAVAPGGDGTFLVGAPGWSGAKGSAYVIGGY
ncbi:MAG: putative metal-binding motif-containing protein [Myxococcota bacterium]